MSPQNPTDRVKKITTHLWFADQAEAAATHYTKVLGGRILDVHRWGEGGPAPAGTVMNVTFELFGERFFALNGNPAYAPSPTFSLFVSCDDQAELDHAWDGLLSGGGEPVRCGWLRDRFGISWQIVPRVLPSLIGDPDRAKAARAMQAMLSMQKLDIAALERAHAGA